jgi:hypothetical protein
MLLSNCAGTDAVRCQAFLMAAVCGLLHDAMSCAILKMEAASTSGKVQQAYTAACYNNAQLSFDVFKDC